MFISTTGVPSDEDMFLLVMIAPSDIVVIFKFLLFLLISVPPYQSSKKKAAKLFEKGILDNLPVGKFSALQAYINISLRTFTTSQTNSAQ